MWALKRRGIGTGALVAVHLDRGPDVIAAMLAAQGVGAAYAVVEPTDVTAVGEEQLCLATPDIVLTASRFVEPLASRGLNAQDVAEAGAGVLDASSRFADITGDDVAYVVYTSGSTGVPKGVLVTHGNIRAYTEALLARTGIVEPLSYAHVTTLAADLGNTCLFLALWTGGTLHLVDEATRRDPEGMLRYLQREQIDVVKTTPSHWHAIFQAFGQDESTRPHVRVLILGGETLPVSLARRVLASGMTRTLINHYGPTETTVGVATFTITAEGDLASVGATGAVPIGTPLGESRLFVGAGDDAFHERNAEGELYVAGPSVALGYRSEASDDAFAEGAAIGLPELGRVYRTGDRVRVDTHGVFEFLGRGDRQVKINGYRVELGHVEAGLRRLTGVADAVALQINGVRPTLVAAVTIASGEAGKTEAQPAELRRRLRDLLPSYMIPERIEALPTFPRTDNGKADVVALRGLLVARTAAAGQARRGIPDPTTAAVAAVWARHLGHRDFDLDDTFQTAGGSSIGAIQVIADLQTRGYRISAAEFLAEPTVAALADRIRGISAGAADPPDAAVYPSDDTALSPAQTWFFRRRFAQPDQWSQALLLDVDGDLRADVLAAALHDVVAIHPMLRTAFRGELPTIRRVAVTAQAVLTTSVLGADAGPDAIASHIRETAALRHAELSVADGILFKAHLFRGAGWARLLLICHHLAVDATSWFIIANDLGRRYGERLRGGSSGVTPAADFGAWVTFLRDQTDTLQPDLAHWTGLRQLPTPRVTRVGDATAPNLECDARSVWFCLSRSQTESLANASAGRSLHTALQATLLAAFCLAWGDLRRADELVVDVESHGRAALDGAPDISRAVGWFTSTFPVRIGMVAGDLPATSKAVASALDAVPHLGIAYGLLDGTLRSDVCFNYLGALTLPYDGDLKASICDLATGPMRGPQNDRVYGVKITARYDGGQLLVDISSTPGRCTPSELMRLARETHANLVRTGGQGDHGQFVVELGSSTGLLASTPRNLRRELAAVADRDYGTVLLTGATGFIGAHLLQRLLEKSNARVYCIVRAVDNQAAEERLRDAYAWYAPDGNLDRHNSRIKVLAGDITEHFLGLDDLAYLRLCHEVEAIYHTAGDTRLFGDRGSFLRNNCDPVRALIRLAETGKAKALHHVSTLAVSGSNAGDSGDGSDVVFNEDCLDVGQRFLNEYERSKFAAERLTRDFAARGGDAFVYRCGDVTGHSQTGRFQRNGADNRLVQLLRGAVYVGKVPQVGLQPLTLSPVDTVADGIFAISRSGRVHGGTFHVAAAHKLPWDTVFAALRAHGYALADDDAPGFAELFTQFAGKSDKRIVLARFWAGRPRRHIRYDHTRTEGLLKELGVTFPKLDRAWLDAFIAGLIEENWLSTTPWGGDAEGSHHD